MRHTHHGGYLWDCDILEENQCDIDIMAFYGIQLSMTETNTFPLKITTQDKHSQPTKLTSDV